MPWHGWPLAWQVPWTPFWVRRALVRTVDRIADRKLCPAINAVRAEIGLPPVRRMLSEWLHSPDRVIAVFPEWFASPEPDWPAQTIVTGFPLYDEADVAEIPRELEPFVAAGDPPLVFTPGSANVHGRAFFEAAADACVRLGRRGILLTRHPEQLPPGLPETVRHFDYVPFSALLPRCGALIYHGGVGTLAQGLKAGLPHLVMPMAFDQPDNATRLKRLGVGTALKPRQFTGPRVAHALEGLLASGDVARRTAELADRLRNESPIGETCDAIEALGAG